MRKVLAVLVVLLSASHAGATALCQPVSSSGDEIKFGALRQQVMLAWEEMAGTAGAESALTNFTLGTDSSAGGAPTALAAATSYTVPSGKTLRITAVLIYTKATSTVNNLSRFRIRSAASVANTSPPIWDMVINGVQAPGTVTAGSGNSERIAIPDGIDIPAGQQVTFTWFTAANTCTVGMTIIGYLYK